MNAIVQKSDERGYANHGWLQARHSFSFANYYNPNKIQFGALRVLNDDVIAAGAGFPEHPHDNMEIITIPLSGSITHKDSLGNESVIEEGQVQVMSAGTGIFHSEYNSSKENELKLFQIWLFPKVKNVKPRYDTVDLDALRIKNSFYQILSPNKEDDGVWIYQNAWFSMGEFDQDIQVSYSLKKPLNGIYLIVIEGNIQIVETTLNERDSISLKNLNSLDIKTLSNTKLLLMEVPINDFE